MNDEIPVTVIVGTWLLAAWCGLQLGFAALHRVLPSDGLASLVALAIAALTVFLTRRSLRGRSARTHIVTFVILSGITFMTLVAPMPLPFTSP